MFVCSKECDVKNAFIKNKRSSRSVAIREAEILIFSVVFVVVVFILGFIIIRFRWAFFFFCCSCSAAATQFVCATNISRKEKKKRNEKWTLEINVWLPFVNCTRTTQKHNHHHRHRHHDLSAPYKCVSGQIVQCENISDKRHHNTNKGTTRAGASAHKLKKHSNK